MTRHLRTSCVSRETEITIQKYIDELLHWNKSIRLTSANFAYDIRASYPIEQYQFSKGVTANTVWADIGSGSGVPGILIAIANPQLEYLFLVESDARKSSFLRSVKRKLNLGYEVINKRAEDSKHIDATVISARAVAPLTKLLEISYGVLSKSGKCLFIKGSSWKMEHEAARKDWSYDLTWNALGDDGTVLLQLRNIDPIT